MKNKKDILIINVMIFLIIICFIGSLYLVYEKGRYDGMKVFCKQDIGVDNFDNIVCYNKSLEIPNLDKVENYGT